jgi:kynureninase
MNSLTANLHFLMISFYRPTNKRFKIIMEAKAFPSGITILLITDYYAISSQIVTHGYDPATSIIEIKPKEGNYTLETADILQVIRENGDEVALVLMSGVQFYTGQLFDIELITREAKLKGCVVGWDLAHAGF